MKLRNQKETLSPFNQSDMCPITLENINELYYKNYKDVILMSDNILYSKKALQRWLDEIEFSEYSFLLPSRKEFTQNDLKKLTGRKRKRNEIQNEDISDEGLSGYWYYE
jgi:hypothetical protein